MTLRDLQAAHARGVLTDPDYLGEEVIYRFKSGSPDVTLRAVVQRLAEEPASPQARQVARFVALVQFATADVPAVAPGDQIVLAVRFGEDQAVARIRKVIFKNAGMTRVEVST